MNKLMGFYELKNSSLPTVKWKKFEKDSDLDNNLLWTIRTAVFHGDDLNLPRAVGKEAKQAISIADDICKKIRDNGIVIYYPYFVAEKSGTLNVFRDRVVIEAVREDLWNLVSLDERDVTIIFDSSGSQYYGNKEFLSQNEIEEIVSYVPDIKYMFRGHLTEGKSILLEWSYAYDCDKNKNKTGQKYLVFYEARTV